MTQTESSSPKMSWRERVANYVDEMAELAKTIDEILDETRVGTVGLKPEEVEKSTAQLAESIARLESMVERRDILLQDPDAPKTGLSLSEKLLNSRKIEDARLARRCGEVAEMISMTHQRATALFVCQYHLSDVQTDLLHRLGGAIAPPTYGASGTTPKSSGGGGLFNKAA